MGITIIILRIGNIARIIIFFKSKYILCKEMGITIKIVRIGFIARIIIFLDDEDNSSSSLNPVIVSVIVVVALFMNFSEMASQM